MFPAVEKGGSRVTGACLCQKPFLPAWGLGFVVVPTQRWARWELRVCVHPHAGRQGVQQPPSCGKGLDGAAAGEARVAGPGPWVSGLRAQPGNGRWAWTGEGFWWVPSGLSPGPPLMSGHTLSLSFPACEAHSWVGSEGWRSWRMWVTGPKAAVHCAVTVPRVTPPGGSTRSRAGRGGEQLHRTH